MDGLEFCGPSLVSVGLGALTRIVNGLLVALRQATELRFKLSLKFRSNALNHAAKRFLCHLFALSGAGSRKSSIENAATLSPRAT